MGEHFLYILPSFSTPSMGVILWVQVPTRPNSGNRLANSKGVHREVESEGSWRQKSDLTNRNQIQG